MDGVFRYTGTDGVVRSVNVMQLSGQTVDSKLRSDFLSKVPGSSNVNNYDVGNSRRPACSTRAASASIKPT